MIEVRMGLNKPVTFHVARHSFATLSLSHDIPIEKVARMLGHKDIKTTQIYAKVLKSTIANHASDLSKVIL
jgi:site-specific recombinase XerD